MAKRHKRHLSKIGKILIFVILAIIVGIIGVIILSHNSQEKKLEKRLQELGVDFYENFYYPEKSQTEPDIKDFLAKYKSTGIKINLDNLAKYKVNETALILEEFTNEKKHKACDYNASKVIIYPKKPYGSKDYRLEVILKCGF